ncbi:MAG TPA: undecaprenyldiphospho-muramoylpentapeptide beta-N-acetylglucosaminyltransferase [Solibacterales bacterium]|nr:undecaprenyldiphospho-muramoylpentapeptide beta-N-acetylglucosaminyltransferase [Bryobacterales bacterium]
MSVFFMAGGGTGGHVVPGLAVAAELKRRGHEPVFIGTKKGYEAKLVPPAGHRIEWIEIGGLNRVGFAQTMRTLWQLPLSTLRVASRMRRERPAGVFSMGGYVAGPVMLAARMLRIPVILMEPNAMPGLTSRRMSRWVESALLSFEEAAPYFPGDRTEVTGLPVREAFFALPAKPRGDTLTVLITGGSRGSRTLNRAARESWPLFEGKPVRLIHQTGPDDYEGTARDFAVTGLHGEVHAFIADMPAAYAQADLVVSRSGAGAVAELAAAGKPSLLVPFPFAADDHQFHNAQALAGCGAARVVRDEELTGERLAKEVLAMAAPGALERMGEAARRRARPGAAQRAADLLESLSFPPHS